MVKQKNHAEVLRDYLNFLKKGYEVLTDTMTPEDFTNPINIEQEKRAEEKEDERTLQAEEVARIADEQGFDGNLFRYWLHVDDVSLEPSERRERALQSTKKQIETIPKIIAKMERPVDRSEISDDAELLNVPQVAKVLNCGESVVRERDKKGLLPKPVRIGGGIQWRKTEILQWLENDCPNRQKWEQIKEGI